MRAGKILLEAENIVHFRAAPAIDRLVVIAHAAHIARAARQKAQPQILGDVGVLILVHQQIAELAVKIRQHIVMVLEDGDVVQQKIAEIAGVQHAQAVLIELVEFPRLAVCEAPLVLFGDAFGRLGAVLPAVDEAGEMARRPALGINALGLKDLLQKPQLVVGVQNGEGGFQPHQLGMAAQDLGGDGVEGAQPRQALDLLADDLAHPLLHLARGLVGEGHRQNVPGLRLAGRQDMRQPRGQHAGLARARARQHQHRAVHRLDRGALFGVQPVKIGGVRTRRPWGRLLGKGDRGHDAGFRTSIRTGERN